MKPQDIGAKALVIHHRLIERYGEQPKHPHLEPVDELVCTILSQNTNDRNRDVAFEHLRAQFPTWEDVREAPLDQIEAAIRPAGLARSKAPRIQAALRRITEEQGQISLDFLAQLSLQEARAWLISLNGVGPKTAAIVLLFSFGQPAFPVDTHIHRISKRLGLIPPKTSRGKAHTLLEALLPSETYYSFHLNLIAHGRDTCHARRPACPDCPLLDFCPYGQEQAPP